MKLGMRSVALMVCGLMLAGCKSLPAPPSGPPEIALAPQSQTVLDITVGAAEATHPGRSGLRLVVEGPESFALRARTAETAGRSLDVQTYIWHDDLTGQLLAKRLVDAADRGVRVRLLLDDWDARKNQRLFATLDAHPNIAVRMFNPFASRSGVLGFAGELLGDFGRLNRRMHNKSWIADNRIAVVGGRNIGNEYFGASNEVNFVDLDFAMIGPIVRAASASFDRYWNSGAAYPLEPLAPGVGTPAGLAALLAQAEARQSDAETRRFARELRGNDAVQRLLAGDWTMQWVSNARFVADDPRKAMGTAQGAVGREALDATIAAIGAAKHELTVISPYFVPGREGSAVLARIAARGVEVRVLTNSLAANDVAAVYGGYSRWRPAMLRGGVKLWEIKPEAGATTRASLFGSSGASLHTKSLAVDGRTLFVGSFNLDPRSASLNTEQGVFVEDEALVAQFQDLFTTDTSGARAWSVGLEGRRVRWSDDQGTVTKTPQASAWRKLQAWLARVLPVESQL